MRQKILVVSAHPDDEVLGCGGTIANHAQKREEVNVLILGEGVTSRFKRREDGLRSRAFSKLRGFVDKVAGILGVKEIFLFNFPDNRFDEKTLLDIVKVVEMVKEKVKPDIIYTHSGCDLNIDHRITHDAVLTACRPIRGEGVREIYSFEVPSSTQWNYPNAFNANMFVDITETIDRKIEALNIYETELKRFPHPCSEEAVKSFARRWGSISGLYYAEAFEAVRIIRGQDTAILLRAAVPGDCKDLWLWRNDPEVRRYLFDSRLIPWEKHKEWFDSVLKDANAKIYLAILGKDKVGNIRFEVEGGHIVVSVNLNPWFFGRGLGAKIIDLGTKKFIEETKTRKQIIAKIKKDNLRSQGAFSKAGYKFQKRTGNACIYIYK